MLRLLALAALAAAAASAQPAPPVSWERVGDRPLGIDLPPFAEDDGTVWAGATEAYPSRGVFTLAPPYDGSVAWTFVPGDYWQIGSPGWVHLVAPDTLLYYGRWLYRSVDGGRTWTENRVELRFEDMVQVPAGLPHAGRIIGDHRPELVTYSDDAGLTWDVSAERPDAIHGADIDRFAVVESGPRAGRVVGAGGWGLTYSDDGGRTWAPTPEYAHYQMRAGCVAALRGRAPGGGDRLLAVLNDIRIEDDSVRVAVSDDGGDTWRRSAALLRGGERTCVDAVDLGGGRAAVAILRGPVYGTLDGGETWAEWGPWPLVDREDGDHAKWLWVDPAGHLWVGVSRRGPALPWVARSSVPLAAFATAEAPIPEAPAGLAVTVAPNPTASGATVAFDLAGVASVTVSVHDVLGREVARTAAEYGAGAHAVALDAGRWSPGVYLVRVETAVEGAAPVVAVHRLTVAR